MELERRIEDEEAEMRESFRTLQKSHVTRRIFWQTYRQRVVSRPWQELADKSKMMIDTNRYL